MPVWPCILVVRTYGGGGSPLHEDRQGKKGRIVGAHIILKKKRKKDMKKITMAYFYQVGRHFLKFPEISFIA